MRSAFALLLLATGVLVAAPVPKEHRKARLTLDGAWQLVDIQNNGKSLRLGPEGNIWTFSDKTLRTGSNAAPVSIKYDLTTSPPQFSFSLDENQPGILSLKGDVLVIVLNATQGERPTDINAAGPSIFRYVFKRNREK